MSGEQRDHSHSALTRAFARRFRWLEKLGQGGLGSVEAAHDPRVGRRVAVKVLRTELNQDERALQEFSGEGQITGQLEHPNIVPIYDLGEDESGPFIVMKLIKGKSLGALLSGATPPPRPPDDLKRFIEIVLRLCDALSFAHSRGVIHCDLKPENVMVGDYGQVYLTDWGAAVLTSKRTKGEDNTGKHIEPGHVESHEAESFVHVASDDYLERGGARGTPVYMSPEQLFGNLDQIDERTDVYGLGGLLNEILTGKPPNSPRSPGVSVARETRFLFAELPPELCRIADKALATRPEDRYSTVAALRADLDQFLQGGGWFATRVFQAGESIVTEGEAGDVAYIIEKGQCDVFKNTDGARVLVRRLGEGNVFGEMAVLTAGPRTASVVAADDVTVKVITSESLNRELERNKWLAAFVRSLAKILKEVERKPPPQSV